MSGGGAFPSFLSMSDDANPYQPPAHATEVPRPAVDLERLRGIAQTQRWVNGWALVAVIAFVSSSAVAKMVPTDWQLAKVFFWGGFLCFLILAIFVGNIQLAYRTKGIGSAVLVGLVSWLPWANLLAAVMVSVWATRMLKDAGFKVGILGVSKKALR